MPATGRRRDRVGRLPAVRRRVRYGWYVDRCRGGAPATCRRARYASGDAPVRPGDHAETYAICKVDLLLKGDGDAADNIVGGPEHSTLSNDAFRSRQFDFMLANPPYGKSWKSDLERMSGAGSKQDIRDPRFVVQHDGNSEFSLVTRS